MRWLLRLVFAVVAVGILGMGALFLVPSDRIAGLAIAKFRDLTGRDLVIEGTARPTFWPVLGVRTGPVRMANADWSDEGPMLSAETLEISVDMASLFGGEVRITGIRAVDPVLVLERARDGRENWVFGGDSGGSVTRDTPGVGKPFILDSLQVSAGRFLFIDHGTGARHELTAIDLDTAIPDFDGPVRVDLAAARAGQPFSLRADLGMFRDFLDGRVGPVTLKLQAGKARVGFKGRAGWNPAAAEGDIDADLAALTEVAALFGTAPPALPKGLGAGNVALKGGFTLSDAGTVHLRAGRLTLDDTVLALDADLAAGKDRPRLVAKVLAGALDLRALTGGKGGGAKGGMAAEGWPRDPIDVSGLGALDAQVSFSADSVDLGLAALGKVQAGLTIDRARAVFDLRRVAAYGGTVSGEFVINGRRGLSVGGDLAFAGMNLEPLLRDLAGYERLLGTGDLRLKFLGVGNSVHDIMQGLEGSGSLSLGKGELRGLDIAGMLRTLDTGYVGEGQKTIFDSVTASFTIDGGVLQNDDLALLSPVVSLTGAGKVGLGARNLTYRLKATALADAEGNGGLTAPLLIKGPWADPTFTLDMKALADQELADEKAALEARAKERAAEIEAAAKARLESELGVVQQEGETLEDAVKRRGEEIITDEAAKALERLLGGGN